MSIFLNQVGQVSMTVDDPDAAERFYEGTLGLRKLFRFGTLVFFDCAGLRLMIDKPEKPEVFKPSSSVLYFRTPDIAIAVRELKTKGVTFVDAPHLVAPMPDHDLWMTFFKDPAGNL